MTFYFRDFHFINFHLVNQTMKLHRCQHSVLFCDPPGTLHICFQCMRTCTDRKCSLHFRFSANNIGEVSKSQNSDFGLECKVSTIANNLCQNRLSLDFKRYLQWRLEEICLVKLCLHMTFACASTCSANYDAAMVSMIPSGGVYT